MKFLTLVERVTFIEGLGMTMIVLVSAEHTSRAAGVEWPVNLFVGGDCEAANPKGTRYTITIEKDV